MPRKRNKGRGPRVSERAAKRRAQKAKQQKEQARLKSHAPDAGKPVTDTATDTDTKPELAAASTSPAPAAPALRVTASVRVVLDAASGGTKVGMVERMEAGFGAVLVRWPSGNTQWVFEDAVQVETAPESSSPAPAPQPQPRSVPAPPVSAQSGAVVQAGRGAGAGAGAASPSPPPVSLSEAIAPSDPDADRCNVCGRTSELMRCKGCAAVWYCSAEHQRQDWPQHKGMCRMLRDNKRSTVIYGERNSKFVGTLRWEAGHRFPTLAPFPQPLHFLYNSVKGWGGFLAARCKSPWQQALANNRGDDKKPPRVCVDGVSAKAERKKQPGEDHAPLLVHPSLLDGLSFPMSVVFAVRQLKWRPPRDQPLTILMLGATYKAEQRLLLETNYFAELQTFFGVPAMHFVLVGPELDTKKGGRIRTHKLQGMSNATYSLVKATTQDFLISAGKTVNPETTIAVAFNSGLGSGNVSLMASWAPGIAKLCELDILCVWTCANHNVDAPGELRVMSEVLNAGIIVPAVKNPFHACSTFHSAARKNVDYSCANAVVYVTKGFAGGATVPPSIIQNASQLHRQLSQIARGM